MASTVVSIPLPAYDLPNGRILNLPDLYPGVPWSAQFEATGGKSPNVLTVLSLPPGLTFTPNAQGGIISGTYNGPAGSIQPIVIRNTDFNG